MSKMNKPDKIFLNNPNLVSTLADGNSNHGTLRETYFINQLQVGHSITGSDQGDFLVDHKYTFEIGGKNKTRKQISGIKDAWIAADNVEYARQDKIPLWLFGFLY
ncbi:MAG TPA: hypothetical protein DC042_08955 [Bacteroidales bacterium]|nr:hypothetical protein [Bacteroidales bacterium]